MSSANDPNKETALAADQKAISGVGKYFANVGTLTIEGTHYTAATLTAVLQGEIDALDALDTVKAQWRQQVATTHGARAKARALRAGLRSYILSTYGATAVQMLEDFGMTVPKAPGPKTAEAKALSSAKAKATRAAKKAALASVAKTAPALTGAASVSTTQPPSSGRFAFSARAPGRSGTEARRPSAVVLVAVSFGHERGCQLPRSP
jgi:hypothetical protein